jgi:hypothetical protein
MLIKQPDRKMFQDLQKILSDNEYDPKHESFLLQAFSYFPLMTVIGLDIVEYLEKIGTLSVSKAEDIPQWGLFPL